MTDYSWHTINNAFLNGYVEGDLTFRSTTLNGATLFSETVNAYGSNWNKGTLNTTSSAGHAGYGVCDTINNHGYIYNSGSIFGGTLGNFTINGGTLVNTGLIHFSPVAVITSNIMGKGTMEFSAPIAPVFAQGQNLNNAELDGPVGAGQTIDMTNDGTLVLGDLRDFHGVIKGFTALGQNPGVSFATQDVIDVKADITSLQYKDLTNGHSDLFLYNGTHRSGTIELAGQYVGGASAFGLSHSGTDSLIQLSGVPLTTV